MTGIIPSKPLGTGAEPRKNHPALLAGIEGLEHLWDQLHLQGMAQLGSPLWCSSSSCPFCCPKIQVHPINTSTPLHPLNTPPAPTPQPGVTFGAVTADGGISLPFLHGVCATSGTSPPLQEALDCALSLPVAPDIPRAAVLPFLGFYPSCSLCERSGHGPGELLW